MAPSREPPPDSVWLDRLVQLLHDPPGKIRYLSYHKRLAEHIGTTLGGDTFTEDDWEELLVPRPDRAAAGADRPCVPWSIRQAMSRDTTLVATHPLGDRAKAPPLRLGHGDERPVTQTGNKAVGERERAEQLEAAKALARELSDGRPEERYYMVWRRLRDELIAGSDPGWRVPEAHPRGDLFWSMLPADTRCPDVSIWDHTRVAAGLAFLTGLGKAALPPAREPYLLKVSLTPVQAFIGMARTSRDLWVGSMLLAELAFQAMTPFIEQYGPTCVLYPDLRANPRMDLWLKEHGFGDALPARAHEPSSFAALVPNTFVVVVPHGANGDRECPLHGDLAAEAAERVRTTWRKLADTVKAWLSGKTKATSGRQPWQDLWDRQHKDADVIRLRWTAVPWLPGGAQQYGSGPIFPFSTLEKRQVLHRVPFSPFSSLKATESADDARVRQAREARLGPWVPEPLWNQSELTRAVFGRSNPGILHSERGFDFAVTHAMLRAVHDARKQVASWPRPTEERGVKCTLCGQRAALTSGPELGKVDNLTAAARQFWSHEDLDPDEAGSERLCAVCAMRRFLVEADRDTEHGVFNKLWATSIDRDVIAREPDGKPRVPFPSTSAIAAQDYLLRLVRDATPAIEAATARVVAEHRKAGLVQTQFPRALARLALAERYAQERRSGPLVELLRIEPQECLYPDAVKAQLDLRARRDSKDPPTSYPLVEAVEALLNAVKTELGLTPPTSRLAVLKVDGDSLGKLLDGDPGRIGAGWADVLHPNVIPKIDQDPTCQAAGWPTLLDTPRMMGPSLHAFISRALGELAHRIVPWVVECEFAGRLIYAGGDDVLALVPADQALALTARLQQLYSAHWVIDTEHEADAWFWRREKALSAAKFAGRLKEARSRFVIPLAAPGADHLPWPPSRRAPYVTGEPPDEPVMTGGVVGPVIPMLGARQSVSAGIVYAHMKDRLGGLIGEAGRALDHDAKGAAGRAAVAVVDRTRGGTKRTFAMKWSPDEASPVVPAAHQLLMKVSAAFADGSLPSRLPYKLREVARALEPMFATRQSGFFGPELRLLRNSIKANLEGEVRDDVLDAAEALWRAGWRLYHARQRKAAQDVATGTPPTLDDADHTLDGLLIALSLARQEES